MHFSSTRWLVALGSGGLAALGFAPLDLWPLTAIGLALLAMLVFESSRAREAFGLAWLWSVAHFTVGLNWIAHAFTYQDAMPHWLGYGAVVGLSLYLALFPAIGLTLAWWGAGKRPISFAFAFAAAWALSEWVRGVAFTGFAWNPVGVVALPMAHLSQLSPWTGTYGLSLLLALASAFFWLLFVGWRVVPIAGLLLLALAAVVPLPSPLLTEQSRPTLVVVQPNFSQDEKHDESYSDRAWSRQIALTRAARTPPGPRLILWPEGAIEEPPYEDGIVGDRVASVLRPGDVMMAGGITLNRGQFGIVTSATNSVFAFGADGRTTGRYDKAHLVPYGEYLPLPRLLGAIGLARLVPGTVYYQPGPGPAGIEVPGVGSVAVQVCYEIIFSGQVLPDGDRPRFLFNPSNDAWFGAWGAPQHLAQARLRAREEGMPVVRSTTNGISAVVDAHGRLVATVARHVAGVIVQPLPPAAPATAFSRYGNSIPLGAAIVTLLLAVALARRRS